MHTSLKNELMKWLKRLPVLLLGATLYAASVAVFISRADLIVGGLTGLSLILNRLTGMPIGLMVIVFNIPLFIFGAKDMGRDFLIGSLIGMLSSSVLIDAFEALPAIAELASERLLSAGIGGAMCGAGIGLVMAAGGSTGGTDILALLVGKRITTISIGRWILISDVVIVGLGALIFNDFMAAIYSGVSMYISTTAVDGVLYGTNMSVVAFIVSKKSKELAEAIIKGVQRGVTVLDGHGGYTGVQQGILMCAVGRRQLASLKRVVKLNDPEAFVIVSEAKEIMGNGFKQTV